MPVCLTVLKRGALSRPVSVSLSPFFCVCLPACFNWRFLVCAHFGVSLCVSVSLSLPSPLVSLPLTHLHPFFPSPPSSVSPTTASVSLSFSPSPSFLSPTSFFLTLARASPPPSPAHMRSGCGLHGLEMQITWLPFDENRYKFVHTQTHTYTRMRARARTRTRTRTYTHTSSCRKKFDSRNVSIALL